MAIAMQAREAMLIEDVYRAFLKQSLSPELKVISKPFTLLPIALKLNTMLLRYSGSFLLLESGFVSSPSVI